MQLTAQVMEAACTAAAAVGYAAAAFVCVVSHRRKIATLQAKADPLRGVLKGREVSCLITAPDSDCTSHDPLAMREYSFWEDIRPKDKKQDKQEATEATTTRHAR